MIRLLYIDDNPDACTIIDAFCERIGTFTVHLLNSGESALEWLSMSTADVIISDYDMPGGMNGITLLRELHSHGNTTPFILFTAANSHKLKKRLTGMVHLVLSAKHPRAKTRSINSSGPYTGPQNQTVPEQQAAHIK